jgi:hypothetical protein
MTNFETGGSSELNANDFGEPTPETREHFGQALELLKQLTVGVPYEERPLVIEGEDAIRMNIEGGRLEIPATPLPTGLGPMTEYRYDQSKDLRFSADESTSLRFKIIDGDAETFASWQAQDEPYAVDVCSIYWTDGDVSLHYRLTRAGDETLEAGKHYQRLDARLDEPESHIHLLTHLKERLERLNAGANITTDKKMNQMISIIEQEVAKRI